ncbi:MAG: hypothetical protein JW876_12035 [Candidatus Krumholzibacteriota bacterium]|nr:hypothetical protein [Candidatus Krumholzibacteriota bacterium]
MKKLLTLILAVTITAALAAPAMATQSRLRAMGDVGNYIEDDANIFSWYATLPSYSNLVLIELQNDDMVWGDYWMSDNGEGDYGDWVRGTYGLTYALGEDGHYGTLAMFFQEGAFGINPFSSYYDMYAPWSGAYLFSDWLWEKWNVMYGYAMDGMSFGLYFARADQMYKEEWTDGEDEEKMAYTTIGVGARFDIGDDMYADLAFDVSMGSYLDSETSYGEITEDANMALGFRGRLFYEKSETITLVPYFSYKMFDFSLQADSADFYDDDECYGSKGMMFDFGVGANIMVNDDNLIVFAIEPFKYMKGEPSDCLGDYSFEGSITTMPRFLMALESDVRDWMTFRTGCSKSLEKYELTGSEGSDEYTETMTWAPFEWYLGLGFHVGDFDVDCVLNKEVPFSMGYWLTGFRPYEDEETPVWMISAKYHF